MLLGNGDVFESNMLVDFDKIVEDECVAPVHETAKMPQYPVNYFIRLKNIS